MHSLTQTQGVRDSGLVPWVFCNSHENMSPRNVVYLSSCVCPTLLKPNKNLQTTAPTLAQPLDEKHTQTHNLIVITPYDQHMETLMGKHISDWQHRKANANLRISKRILPTESKKG